MHEQVPDNLQQRFWKLSDCVNTECRAQRHSFSSVSLCWGTWGSSEPRLLWWVLAKTEHHVSIKYFVDDPRLAMTRAIDCPIHGSHLFGDVLCFLPDLIGKYYVFMFYLWRSLSPGYCRPIRGLPRLFEWILTSHVRTFIISILQSQLNW